VPHELSLLLETSLESVAKPVYRSTLSGSEGSRLLKNEVLRGAQNDKSGKWLVVQQPAQGFRKFFPGGWRPGRFCWPIA